MSVLPDQHSKFDCMVHFLSTNGISILLNECACMQGVNLSHSYYSAACGPSN